MVENAVLDLSEPQIGDPEISVQALDPNIGMEYYPDLFSLFQVLPLAVDRTLIKLSCYSPPDMSEEEREMQQINLAILHEVNGQDKTLVERIQRGVRTSGYQPGPLGLAESSVFRFHERGLCQPERPGLSNYSPK